uniref:Ion transport domain-containing protein n=2 Tax=Scylla olivacea TaxID=85551 RepID=A0A0P4VYA6_SCYOL
MNSSLRSRHLSFQGDKRGSVNEHLDSLFNAIETRSLDQLRECLRQEPQGIINGHGGPFYVTPLHSAVEAGWVEGVRELLEQGASVCVRNQYDQTPLHYAATARQQAIVTLLLECHSSAAAVNLQDMRGRSPLHEGAAAACLPVVRQLLDRGAAVATHDKQGESPLHKAAKAGALEVMVALMAAGADLRERDLRGMCALRWLALSTPHGLPRLLDHLLVTSGAGSRHSPVTFEFSALATHSGTQQCQLLSYLIETHNREMLEHPVCHAFLLIKWKRGKLVFLGYLLYFVVYALLTSLFIFMRQLRGRSGDHALLPNATHDADAAATSFCLSPRGAQGVQVLLCVMTLLLLVTQLNRLRIQGWACVRAPNFWLQLSSAVCVSSLLASSWRPGVHGAAPWEHHVGTVELLLLQLQFLLILRKYPSHGLYVAMFIRVAEDFLKLFFVYCTLLVSFTATMFLVFNARPQQDPVYSRWPLLFLKSVTMMVGSVDVTGPLAGQLDRLPYTSYLLFFLFILFIPIVLANLLVALAVSDIRELRASAHLTRLAR